MAKIAHNVMQHIHDYTAFLP